MWLDGTDVRVFAGPDARDVFGLGKARVFLVIATNLGCADGAREREREREGEREKEREKGKKIK